MFLMTTSLILCPKFIFFNQTTTNLHLSTSCNTRIVCQWGCKRRRGRIGGGFIPNAKKGGGNSRKKSWWKKFFFDDDGNWLGLKDEDMIVEEEYVVDDDDELSETEKFEAWRRRAEAIVELREAQEDMRNEENRKWEDWIVEDPHSSTWVQEPRSDGVGQSNEDFEEDLADLIPGKGFTKSLSNFVLGKEDDDLLYEDRVFQYASTNSARFLAVLIIVPTAMDILVHDYVLLPFLDRYVKTVPLAAQILDVRKHQKLEMIKELKLEKAKFKLEVEIGKSPPLSDDEMWLELRHKALELQEDWRLENRKAFANIWSDMVFGVSLFILLYLNQSKVALLKFTGYKIINNISDTGKAFLIILVTDIFLGYHSESGWQTLLEIIVEHYGFDVDQAAITIFVCLIPVILDACVKLWMFKFLPRLSPRVANIFREMTRH
ncbi:hypothetical protein AgCh_010142 [Apium graveolens]